MSSPATLDTVGAAGAAGRGDSLQMHLHRLRLLDGRHVDRPVFTATWGAPGVDAGRAVIVKCFQGAGAAARAEAQHHVGEMLWSSTAGETRRPPAVPRPIAVGPFGAGAAVVMEAIDGTALGARDDLGCSLERAGDAAVLFADLHSAVRADVAVTSGAADDPWPGVPRRSASRVVRSVARKLDELSPVAAAAARPLLDLVRDEGLRIRTRGEHLVVVHGDATPRNVFDSSTGLRFIDLDRVQLAGAGRDLAAWLAWQLATAWTGRGAACRRGTVQPTDDVVVTYLRRRAELVGPAADRVVDEICADLPFHLAAAFVRLAHGWSALRGEPSRQRQVLVWGAEVVADAPSLAAGARRRAEDESCVDRCGGGGPSAIMPGCGHDGGRGRTWP